MAFTATKKTRVILGGAALEVWAWTSNGGTSTGTISAGMSTIYTAMINVTDSVAPLVTRSGQTVTLSGLTDTNGAGEVTIIGNG